MSEVEVSLTDEMLQEADAAYQAAIATATDAIPDDAVGGNSAIHFVLLKAAVQVGEQFIAKHGFEVGGELFGYVLSNVLRGLYEQGLGVIGIGIQKADGSEQDARPAAN